MQRPQDLEPGTLQGPGKQPEMGPQNYGLYRCWVWGKGIKDAKPTNQINKTLSYIMSMFKSTTSSDTLLVMPEEYSIEGIYYSSISFYNKRHSNSFQAYRKYYSEHLCAYIYTHIYLHAYTHLYTCIHTYICMCFLLLPCFLTWSSYNWITELKVKRWEHLYRSQHVYAYTGAD